MVGITLKGVKPLWEAVKGHREHMEKSGRLKERRAFRAREEVKTIIASSMQG